MTVCFPSYYKKFKCIAEKCRHSCCVSWEIGVDEETMNMYKESEGEIYDEIMSHIDTSDSTITLLSDGRCPFLDNSGLCRLICRMGEGGVSLICREHPRFYHSVMGRVEGGIGAVCEEACRIILTSDDYDCFDEYSRLAEAADETDFDSISHREYIYSVLKNRDLSYTEKINAIRERYSLPQFHTQKEEWREAFMSLEYLDESRRGIFGVCDNAVFPQNEIYFIRFFAYLVFRHVSISENYDELRARVGYCLLLLSVLQHMSKERVADFDTLAEWVRVISEEIEYSEDNTASLIFEIECLI